MGLTGGCMCGSVRYELKRAPFDAGWCHCTTCQKISGAPGMVWASIPRADFVYVAEESALQQLTVTTFAERAFCRRCGSPLTIAYEFQPETLDFAVCTLDHPSAVAPEHHIFWKSGPDWLDLGDRLPRHEKFRPGTRGLDGVEPPGN